MLIFSVMRIFVGITGASGQIYAGRLLKALNESGNDVTACFSDGAIEVLRREELNLPGKREQAALSESRAAIIDTFLSRHEISLADISVTAPEDMGCAFASGSFLVDAAVICPCSMSSLASIAAGVTRNLIHRVADVMLKEGRQLLIVPRETPLSEIHLRNMLTLAGAGARIVPAMPAFYHQPASIEDLVDFVVGKVLDQLGVHHELFQRWQG